jgi:hypothetical protein
MDVSLDPAKITRFSASKLRKLIVPDMSAPYTPFQLNPEVSITGLSQAVKIRSLASYQILSHASDSAVKVDGHGMVTPVHAGTAVIGVSFQGQTDQVTIVVK